MEPSETIQDTRILRRKAGAGLEIGQNVNSVLRFLNPSSCFLAGGILPMVPPV